MGTPLRRTPATLAVVEQLLRAPASEGAWGLQIIRETGLAAGSVYPILARLEAADWVSSQWETTTAHAGPRRRYYQLTALGQTQARALIAPRPATTVTRTRTAFA